MRNFTYILFVLTGILSLVSCQSEKHEVLTEENQQGFTEGSEFYSLVEKSSMHDGSQDDELDESPCFSINFPYRVEMNESNVRISSTSDLEVVLKSLRDLGSEGFSFSYPLTLTWSNYETVSVANKEELMDLKNSCAREASLKISPVTCVEIEFPIQLLVYNINAQTTNSVNIASKKQLYVFLQNNNSNEVLSFDYPVTVTFTGGTKIQVNNNNEFTTALKSCNN